MKESNRVLNDEDLMTLVTIGRELAEQSNLDSLLVNILKRAGALTDSPDASIILYSKRLKALYFAQSIGKSAPLLLKKWGELGEKNIPLNENSRALEDVRRGNSE